MKTFALSIAMAALTLAQVPGSEKKPEFEVASIRPTDTKDGSFSMNYLPGGRYSARGMTVKILLREAYVLQDYQVQGGPDWINSAGFDIEARAAEGAGELPRAKVQEMVQTLLADRFQLAMHRETRQVPVYDLVVGKTGPRLRPADSNPGGIKTMIGQLIVKKMSMATLASILTFDVKRPVRDETGLKGEFAFTLEWAPGLGEADASASARPSLFTALQEQLGLKLESAKGPVEVVVIDRVEKPSGN